VPFVPPPPLEPESSSAYDYNIEVEKGSKRESDLKASSTAKVTKGFSMSLSSGKSNNLINNTVASKGKRVLKDIKKWDKILEEERKEDDKTEANKSANIGDRKTESKGRSYTQMEITENKPQVSTKVSASTTSKESVRQPVCLLCRRQFASTEQLERHEKRKQTP